jgi:hypothetical protein
MKNISFILGLVFSLLLSGLLSSVPATAQKIRPAENNDFYDNLPFKDLPLENIEIAGEVASPGLFNLKGLPLHQVQVREAVLNGHQLNFIGAYVYQGYSLFDILKNQILAKKIKNNFLRPLTCWSS